MAARRPTPDRRCLHRRAALAAGTAGVLVLAPAAGALAADDAAPPEQPPADEPTGAGIVLPSAEPEDQVGPPAPSPEATVAAVEAPVESYFGTHKITAELSVTVDPLADNQLAIAVLHDDGVTAPWETYLPLGPTDLRELMYPGTEALTFTVHDANEDYWFVGSPLIVPQCIGDSSGIYCRADFVAPLERKVRGLRVAVVSGGAPLAGAPVELRRLSPSTGATAFVAGTGTTDLSGVVDFGLLPTGDYEAVVSPPAGLAQVPPGAFELSPLATREASLDPANAAIVTVQVGPYASRQVTPAFAPTPAPAAGTDLSGLVQVRRTAAGGGETVETVTLGADGRAVSPLVQAPGETLELTVVDPPAGYMIADGVTIPPRATADGDVAPPIDAPLVIPAAYRRLQVRVTVDGPSVPVEGLAVAIVNATMTGFVAIGTTDAAGRATLDAPVPVGTHPLMVASLASGGSPYQLLGGGSVQVTAVDSVAQAEAEPQVVDATVLPYRPRQVVPVVRSADPATVDADLTSQVRVTTVGADGPGGSTTVQVGASGEGDGVGQTAWPMTVEIVTPPAGFMLAEPAVVTVEPCPLDLATACDPVEVVLDVVPAHRRVTLRAVDQDGRPVPGVTMELYGPADADLAPVPSPSTLVGEDVSTVLAAAPSTSGRPWLGGGTTSVAGTVSIPGNVRPGAGFLVVVTGVPTGYTIGTSVTVVDIPAVGRVADAALALDVRLTGSPVVRPPVAPRGVGTGTLPATGAEPGRTSGLALVLVALGVAGVVVRRRAVDA